VIPVANLVGGSSLKGQTRSLTLYTAYIKSRRSGPEALLRNQKRSRNPTTDSSLLKMLFDLGNMGSCHKRQKPQAPTPQAPVRNRQTRKVANAKGLNRNTNLT